MQTARWKARVATGVLSLLVSTGCGCAARLPVATPSLHRQTIAADVVPQPTVSETVFLRTRLDATAKKTPAAAADGGGGGDLSAAAQNPIASNVSLPFENSFMFGAGPDNDAAWVMNIQPVIPVPVGPVNLITRPILPVMYMPGPVTGLPFIDGVPSGEDSADQFGIGDLNVTTFVSPRNSKKIIWGVGPSVTFPTATDPLLGGGKWAIGPSLVALTIRKPWLVGCLVRHLWSFAGDDGRADVNQLLVQPFLNYNLDDGWYLVTAPVFVGNWSQPSSERWTVPIGAGAGRIFKIGQQPVNVNAQVYYNVERPTDAPDWQLKFTVQFIFPKKS